MRLKPFLAIMPIFCALLLPAYAVETTNIPECDALLNQYESCGLEVLTGGEKLQFEKSILESAMSFRVSSSNEQQRAALVQLCTESMKALKANEGPFKACMNREMPH